MADKMNIAQVATSWIRVPPADYGGAELIVSQITEGLVSRGHQVTLFASGDSVTRSKLVSCIPKAPGVGLETLNDINLRSRYYKTSLEPLLLNNNFDVIHWHVSYDLLPYLAAQLSRDIPAVVTFHNFFPGTENILENTRSCNIAISKSSQKIIPVDFCSYVYNGINLDDFQYIENYEGENIIWLGRFSPVKGTDVVIKIANQMHKPALLAANPSQNDYYTKVIVPALKRSKYAKFIGPVGGSKKSNVLGDARLFLNPIDWEEQFGLVVPEANACGTPVVAYARGAMPELIKDGITGFLVNPSAGDKRGNWIVKKSGIEGMVEAVKKIYDMPESEYRAMRKACREHVEKNFTVEKMVSGYEEVYKKVIKDWTNKQK